MKRFILFSFLYFGLIISSIAQKSDKKQNLPRENSKVTREYDEKGNLIRFDSVYSYSNSSDSALMKNFSPKDISNFSFFNDSALEVNSFFDEFDKMFTNPYSHFDQKQDSIAFKSKDFEDLLGLFFESGKDSSSVKRQDQIAGKSQLKPIDDMMKMMQQQMQKMEKMQQKLFEENQKFKEF